MKKILFMLSVIVFGISPAVSAVSDILPTRMKAYSTDGGNYLRDVFVNGEGQYVDKMGSLINEADVIDPDLMKNLTTNLTPQTPNPTPQVTPTPSANPSATNTHWGVNRDTGAMEKLTKQGNRFYDQSGNQISAKGENIKTYKYDELDKANKYAEGIAKKRMSGSTGTGGAGGTGATGGSAGGIAQKIGYEGVGKLTAGQAAQVGMGMYITYSEGKAMTDTMMETNKNVGWGNVAKAAMHGAGMGMGVSMAMQPIPVWGQVASAVAIAGGAAIGAGFMLSRMSSQNDCVTHPLDSRWTECCNITDGNAALMGDYVENLAVGSAIHNGKFPYINYCGQKDVFGSGTYKTYQGKLKNDEWLEPEVRFCKGYNYPDVVSADQDYKTVPVAFWEMENGHTVPCWKWECSDEGYIKQGNKCVPDPNAKNKPEDEEPDGKNPNPAAPKRTCNDLYAGHPERLACCKAGKTTKWSDSNDLDGGYCYCVDVKTQQPDNTKTWNGAKCIDADQETDCTYTFSAKIICANGGVVDANTMVRLEKDDLNGKSCNDFKSLLNRDQSAIMKLAEKYCTPVEPVVVPEPTIDLNAVNAARDRLAAFFKQVDGDRSVWKNADGSFNATRLASDLTAGVVLGTVGGVVSGVLIKKSQVEKGFEALNCTVNGQKVADWGDEFRINFRM